MNYFKKFMYKKNNVPHPPYFWMSVAWILFITSVVMKLIDDKKQIDSVIQILGGICAGVTTLYKLITDKYFKGE